MKSKNGARKKRGVIRREKETRNCFSILLLDKLFIEYLEDENIEK